MFNFTDLIVVLFVFYFIYSGWSNGILKTLSGPLAFVLCIFAAFVYFQRTHNLIYALLIGIFGPIALRWFFSYLLSLLDKIVSEDEGPSVLSRILGVVVNVIWSGTLLLLTIFCLAVLPFDFMALKPVKQNIQASYSVHFLAQQVPALGRWKPRPQEASLVGMSEDMNMDQAVADLKNSQEFKEIMHDPRVKDLISDETIKKDIENKDVMSLLRNPKFVQIMNDPELVEKFISVYMKAQESQITTKLPETPDEQVSPVPQQPLSIEDIYNPL